MHRDGSRRLVCWTALLVAGCTGPTAPPPAAAMLGTWSYNGAPASADAPSLNARLHVDIAVESVEGMQFAGRVTRWLAGDVGIAPDAFGPLTGNVDGAGSVAILIAPATPGAPALGVTGDLSGDVLTIRESWSGTGLGPFTSGGAFRRTR